MRAACLNSGAATDTLPSVGISLAGGDHPPVPRQARIRLRFSKFCWQFTQLARAKR